LKWLGCCPNCQEWNSLVEQQQSASHNARERTVKLPLQRLASVPSQIGSRIVTGIAEWDRVLGGGIMPGSLMILTGDPGIGKSTLLVQIAAAISKQQQQVFYFSSEESLEQVKLRAERIVDSDDNVLFSDSADLGAIIATAQEYRPTLMIVDSIQNCYLTDAHVIPGSVGQLREAGFRLMRLAKEYNIAIIATGHITKEGTIAGPKTLEHMVDAVFYLQGDNEWDTRLLRSVKNRFGAINEIGFFSMGEEGLEPVANINERLLAMASYSPGSVIISYNEGSRPLLLEVQALVIPSKLALPQRVITGADHKQVVLIAAILEKYLQIKLSTHDIFFKISGGFKVKESSADLGIALALLSSYLQQTLPEKTVAIGELNLTGHIQPITRGSLHIQEAAKFGLQHIIIATKQQLDKTATGIIRLGHVYELMRLFNS
ncbi:DNA repair protein RadA, partial [Candidatus Dependentiae bacterium]|nr:DNA repair protein RadA [Candidatus Dependentiae bacterium]